MGLFSKGDVAVEFEEYKSKLQMLRDSLNELRDYRSRRYNAACDYIRSTKTTEEKIQEQLILVQKNHSDEENDLIAQLEFVDFLAKKGIYMELTKEIIEALQGRQLISSDRTTTKSADNTAVQDHAKNNLPKSKEAAVNAASKCNQANAASAAQKTAEAKAANTYAGTVPHKQKQQAEENKQDATYDSFMKAYNEGSLKNDAQRLSVRDEIFDELMWISFEDWKDFATGKEINLVDTARQPQYYAYDGADYIADIKQRAKYYLLVPAKNFAFNEMGIKNYAMLAFFDLPGDGRECLNGVQPKLVRPAVLKKEANGEYVLCKDKQGKLYKGEYKL